MKILLIYFAILMLFESCGSKGSELTGADWTTITYNYQTGSLPPKYYYAYTIELDKTGAGQLAFYTTYGNEHVHHYTFTATAKQLEEISMHMQENGAFENDIPAIPESEQPNGSAVKWLKAMRVNPNPELDQPPRIWQTPDFPQAKYEGKLNMLYNAITAAVPKHIWDDTKNKKSEFEKNYQE